MMDLRSVDLHLLACFDALMAEGSVTHAAVRMNLSQPAMSNALARLRDIFRDPLLVRTPRGMVATPRANELHVLVRDTLRAFTSLMSDGEDFDASATTARITLAVSDYTSSLLVPHLMPLLRREAPGMELTFVAPDQSRVREGLESGDFDLMLGYFIDLPEGLRAMELSRDSFACIVSTDHPVIRDSIDLAGYVAAAHVRRGTATTNPFTLEMMVDRALEERGVGRRVVLRTPTAFGLAQAVASSDLVGTLAGTGARQYARTMGIRVLDLPFEIAAPAVTMVWHERTHRQAALRWFREAVRRCGAWQPGRD
jgi:DNA-binding transcriptional LysR family regulator